MHLSSSALHNGKFLPTKYAFHGVVGGKNYSIPLQWDDIPHDTKSFCLSMIDTHPIANHWMHWIVINIPSTVREFPESISGKSLPIGSKELYNSFGTKGYGGPQPPSGSGPHSYVITLYALDVAMIDLPASSSYSAFTKSIEEHTLASAKIVCVYERS